MPRPLSCSLALLAVVACPKEAAGSPLLDLTGGADGPGGMQPRNIGGGASAAYFNPALLVDAPAGVGIGFLMITEGIGISLDGRPSTGAAIPSGISNAAHADGSAIGNVPIPTSDLQANHPRQAAGTGHQIFAYESVEAVAKLFDDQLSLGFYAIVPDGNFTNLTAFYADEREQYFTNSLHAELYDDRLTSVSVAGGLGWRLSEQLAVGVGASLSLRAGVGAPTFVSNAGDLAHLLIDTNANVDVSLSPNLGVAYRPAPRLRLTGTVHAPEKMELGVGFTFLLPGGLKQGSDFTLVYDYMPWQIGAGIAYDVVRSDEHTLTVAGTALYGKWSGYTDRHGDAPVPAYGWYDTLTPTVGVRYEHGGAGFALDAQYKPTPVPPQTGRTNYVDNDRLGFGGGFDYRFVVFHSSMRLGAQVQAYWLIPRYQTKLPTPAEPDGLDHYPALVRDELPDDSQVGGQPIAGSQGLQTNNPGWPGFGSAGLVVTSGLYVTVIR